MDLPVSQRELTTQRRTRYARKLPLALTSAAILDYLAAFKKQREHDPTSEKLEIRGFLSSSVEAHSGTHVVIKNTPCVAEIAASFDLKTAILTVGLLYDTHPPHLVDYVKTRPVEAFLRFNGEGTQQASIECRISVLTSQHENNLFRFQLIALTSEGVAFEAVSPPIKVISKFDARFNEHSDSAADPHRPARKRRRTSTWTSFNPALIQPSPVPKPAEVSLKPGIRDLGLPALELKIQTPATVPKLGTQVKSIDTVVLRAQGSYSLNLYHFADT